MSVMEEADIPPVSPDDAGPDGEPRRAPDSHPSPASPPSSTVEVRDAETGDARRRPGPHPPGVDAHDRHPRRPRHLRPPAPRADRHRRACSTVEATFPTGRDLRVHTEFRRKGRWPTSSTATPSRSPAPRRSPVAVPAGDVRAWHRPRRPDHPRRATPRRRHQRLHPELRPAPPAGSRPVTDLQPYLGAAGHVVVMRADGSTFAHRHAETFDSAGRPVLALPGHRVRARPRPARPVRPARRLPAVGAVRLADGTVVTAPFVVHPQLPNSPAAAQSASDTIR